MIRCQFQPTNAGCRCKNCGREVRGHDGDKLIAECVPRAGYNCRHRGEPAGAIRVACSSQAGKVKEVPAFKCNAFGPSGRCLPLFAPSNLKAWEDRKPESQIYHLCVGCEFAPG